MMHDAPVTDRRRPRLRLALILACLFVTAVQADPGDFSDGLAAYQRGDYSAARSFWESGARDDDARSMFSLGALFASGTGVERDSEFAYSWFLRAAEAGQKQAQYNVALMLEEGNGVDRDPDQALGWYEKAAKSGLPQAQMALGTLYWGGRGVEADQAEAMRWFESAAERGHQPAAQRLSRIYEERGEPARALELTRRFAESGFAEAQNNLGVMLENGVGIKPDPRTAREWYRRAADQGLDEAMVNLARVYKGGIGGEKDEKASVEWIARARGTEPSPVAKTPSASQTVAPATNPPRTARTDNASWFDNAPAQHMTVQLAGSSNVEAMQRFVADQGIAERSAILSTLRSGKTWYIVVFGNFIDRSSAKAAVEKLSDKARSGGPWVRKIGEVRESINGG